jgi:hypothetical protein
MERASLCQPTTVAQSAVENVSLSNVVRTPEVGPVARVVIEVVDERRLRHELLRVARLQEAAVHGGQVLLGGRPTHLLEHPLVAASQRGHDRFVESGAEIEVVPRDVGDRLEHLPIVFRQAGHHLLPTRFAKAILHEADPCLDDVPLHLHDCTLLGDGEPEQTATV